MGDKSLDGLGFTFLGEAMASTDPTAENTQCTSVMFIDDDIAALARLEQLVKSTVPEWSARFFAKATDALESCRTDGAPDAIITDLRMPEMDGASLLEAAKREFPNAIRMVFSDYDDLPVALRSVPVAHQFLASPLDVTTVYELVNRDVELQRRINDPNLQRLVSSIDVLPSPPASVIEINRLVADPFSSIEAVAEAIRTDSAMSAKLLQLVNSAFFGLSNHVEDVQQAVALLGFDTVRNLLIAVELVRSFNAPTPDLVRAVEDLNAHSFAVAELSRSLMMRRKGAHEAFVGGMMHDIGLLAVIGCAPQLYLSLKKETEKSGRSVEQCELEILGTTHASIGAYLLGLWGLPFSLVEAVARSHDADVVIDNTITPVHAIFIAERITNVLGSSNVIRESDAIPSDDYLEQLGVTETVAGILGKASATTALRNTHAGVSRP